MIKTKYIFLVDYISTNTILAEKNNILWFLNFLMLEQWRKVILKLFCGKADRCFSHSENQKNRLEQKIAA